MRALAPLLLVALASGAAAEVLVLRDGDRITGQIVSRGTRRIRLQTAYGLLVVPVEKIERIRKDDGSEELLHAPPAPLSPSPRPTPIRLVLDLGGNTFWQAWDPKTPPADPSLQFVVRIDGKPVAAYVDSALDPGDLPKAVVNSFAFNPETLKLLPSPGVLLAPPQVKEGRVRLPIELPVAWGGTRRMRVAYQANEGTSTEVRWHDLTAGEAVVDLRGQRANTVIVEQARGFMEFAKKAMKSVDSFQLALHAE